MSDLKTIRLYGKLGARFGRVHRFAVRDAAEAVQALSAQHPGFEQYLTEAKDKGMGFSVFYGKRNLKEENLQEPAGKDDIRIAPVMFGAKRGGWLQVIVGIVLILVGSFTTIFTAGTSASLVVMGWGMVIGGVIQLLTPVPKSPDGRDKPDANASYVFNGPVNTQAQGNPVPVLYGRLIVGSSVISAGILAEQRDAGRTYTSGNSGGGSYSDKNQYHEDVVIP